MLSFGGLEFRDLHAFNLALLAKQGWRIISNLLSFMVKVLKARYFFNSFLWDASRLCGASVIWKIICNARCVLERGSRWSSGNGQFVSF